MPVHSVESIVRVVTYGHHCFTNSTYLVVERHFPPFL